MINTAFEIKHVENVEVLNAIELGLERILVEECDRGLPNDINYSL
jgi:hypothetical protein